MKRIIIGILFAVCFMSGMWLIDQLMEKNFYRYLAVGLLCFLLYTIHRLFISINSYKKVEGKC
ncbi:hypothetical protein [Bacillus ndiopicus]|uniref:hypothetical protein n=1 Tax=Bacillus ndiopicus TaxID=1347368 RepID=UPI0012B5C1F5|nr:hypothetical protein [Bacillus ndiopicus]